jgi:hypothetical protein
LPLPPTDSPSSTNSDKPKSNKKSIQRILPKSQKQKFFFGEARWKVFRLRWRIPAIDHFDRKVWLRSTTSFQGLESLLESLLIAGRFSGFMNRTIVVSNLPDEEAKQLDCERTN